MKHSTVQAFRENRKSLLFAFTSALLLFAQAFAGDHWLSRESQPGVFDVVVTLTNSPAITNQADYEAVVMKFADAVFEESNGAHQIGRVSIYTKGDYADKCDILWRFAGSISAPVSGRGVAGQHIQMCDFFFGSDMLGVPESGGNALAAAWGHYSYGLYPEFRGDSASYNSYDFLPHQTDNTNNLSILNSFWNASGSNYAWLNFSSIGSGGYSNSTAQFRMHDTAGWETLSRDPEQDPRVGARVCRPPRHFFPELAAAAPSGGSPQIDLPSPAARDHLAIVWMSTNQVMQILIDTSDSVSGTNLDNARLAAKLLVDLAETGTAVGIITAGDSPQVRCPLTVLTNATAKTALKDLIDTIAPGGSNALADAISEALKGITNTSSLSDTRYMFVLSEESTAADTNLLTLVSACREAGTALFALEAGTNAAQSSLRFLAERTGGTCLSTRRSAGEFVRQSLMAATRSSRAQALDFRTASVLPGSVQFLPIQVDSSLRRVMAFLTYTGDPTNSDARLVSPSGTQFRAISSFAVSNETVLVFDVDRPQIGGWTLLVDAVGSRLDLQLQTAGWSSGRLGFSLSLANLGGSTLPYPRPGAILATIQKQLPLSSATISATYRTPSGLEFGLNLRDDGTAPDVLGADGNYSALLAPTENGIYEISVVVSNNSGRAKYTYNGSLPLISSFGTSSFPADAGTSELFTRATRLQLLVTGATADDHGNTPNEATPLPADNRPLAGNMEIPGDIDLFSITPPPGLTNLAVRVSDLALGMAPVLTLYGADQTNVLATANLATSPASRGYLYLIVTNVSGVVYASVTHASPNGTGLYSVSAGPVLDTDIHSNPRVNDLTAASAAGVVTLNWTGVPDPAIRYRVFRARTFQALSTPAVSNLVASFSLTTTNGHYEDPSAMPGTPFYYAVTASSAHAPESPMSPIVVGTNVVVWPVSVSTNVGGDVSLCVTAVSDQPISYQWIWNRRTLLQDSGLISGAQAPCLDLRGVTQAGIYEVRLTSPYGSVTGPAVAVFLLTNAPLSFSNATYGGLYYPPAGFAPTNSGSVSLAVTSKRKFTGSLRTAGGTMKFSGEFDTNGFAQVVGAILARPPITTRLDLQYDLTPGSERIVGVVTDGRYLAGLFLHRAGLPAAAPATGRRLYALTLPATDSSTNQPTGWGALTASLASNGKVSVSGSLADGTKVTHSSSLSVDGFYPLYAKLYGSKGLVISWLQFSPDSVEGAKVLWVKPKGSAKEKYYPDGFALVRSISGDVYLPTKGLLMTNGPAQLIFSAGEVQGSATNDIILNNNKIVSADVRSKISLSLNPSTGLLSGSVRQGGTSQSWTLGGILAQDGKEVVGWYLGTNRAGSFVIRRPGS
jgi:hypothetical protein